MFSLLPEKNKKNLKKEYLVRYIILILLMGIFCIFIFIVSLVPAYINVNLNKKLIETSLKEQNNEKESLSADEADRIFDVLEKQTSFLIRQQQLTSFVLTNITEHLDTGISILKLYGSYDNKEGWTIKIDGTANSREGLSAFVDRIKADGQFKKINLPVSDLVKSENINFSIEIKENLNYETSN